MSENKQKAILEKMKEFVSDLCEKSDDKPSKLFGLLVKQIDTPEHKHFDQVIKAFDEFYQSKRSVIKNGALAKEKDDVKISVNDKIYINIIKIYKDASVTIRQEIEQDLLMLGLLMNPQDKEMLDVLEQLEKNLRNLDFKTDSKEGEFLGEYFKGALESMKDADPSNPTEMVTNMMKSGMFENMAGSLQKGMQNGEISFAGIMTSMQSMMGNIVSTLPDIAGEAAAPPQKQEEKVEKKSDEAELGEPIAEIPEPVTANLEAFNRKADMMGVIGAVGNSISAKGSGGDPISNMMSGFAAMQSQMSDGNGQQADEGAGMVGNIISSSVEAAVAAMGSSK